MAQVGRTMDDWLKTGLNLVEAQELEEEIGLHSLVEMNEEIPWMFRDVTLEEFRDGQKQSKLDSQGGLGISLEEFDKRIREKYFSG